MKKNFHKSCGNCYHYQRMHSKWAERSGIDFGGLCLLLDAKGTPQYQAPHYWCKLWKGIKYNKTKERIRMKEMFKGRS